MAQKSECSCGAIKYNMVFACSGAADVGAVADQAARTLAREKKASMCCTAAIGAAIPDIVEKALGAPEVLAIDGCDKDCARIILTDGGIAGFAHLRLQDIGMEKGKTPPTDENVKAAAAKGAALLAG
ncbi:MAG: zinc-binding protein [bacterium]|nr:zinc-binding protein [bacterium]